MGKIKLSFGQNKIVVWSPDPGKKGGYIKASPPPHPTVPRRGPGRLAIRIVNLFWVAINRKNDVLCIVGIVP